MLGEGVDLRGLGKIKGNKSVVGINKEKGN